MLQIALRLFLLMALAAVAAPAWALPVRSGEDSSRVEWLLQCSDNDELVPLSQVAVTLPADVRSALDRYHTGEYRRAAENLEKLRILNLPDGRMDFVVFVLAESYRKLGCRGLAGRDYRTVIENFPTSENAAPSFYRLLEIAVANDEQERADSIYAAFCSKYAAHPLINAVHYLGALNDYGHGVYDSALKKLSGIPSTSSVLPKAHFLSALCRIQTREYRAALETLTELRKSGSGEIGYETSILIGDINYLQNNPGAALKYYRKVPEKAKRFKYAQVKIAQCCLDLGNYARSAKLARQFLDKNPANSYYFEIASILEQDYGRLGDKSNSALTGQLIRREIVNARLAFEIFDEIDRIADMLSSWQGIEHQAIRDGLLPLQKEVNANSKKLQDLETRYYALLQEVAPAGAPGNGPAYGSGRGPRTGFPFQAERRYLGMLKTRKDLFDDTIADLQKRITAAGSPSNASEIDTLSDGKISADSLRRSIDSLKHRGERCDHEYATVVKECIGKEFKNREGDEELQAKFVDWVFAKYQENKEELKHVSAQLAARSRLSATGAGAGKSAAQVSASPAKGAAPAAQSVEKMYTEADRNRLIARIAADREDLVSHLRTSLDVYPKSKYNSQILFRLAELYFDAAGDEFQAALKVYEQKMAQGKDTAGREFPEYHLDKVVSTYDDIISRYAGDETAEHAYFFKALALQKSGKDDDANGVLLALIEKFPQSQYFVEANMLIGKYYFDHPKTGNGHGYALAADAYRRALLFRDHPQYYSALYRLGWCYYMQDQHEDAIAVFKYLIEGSHPDFDLAKREDKQVKNPLLREEAIDYIAVSYDLIGNMNAAVDFLKLTNSPDYSAMVVKRIGELREEDLDYTGAIRAYRRLLLEYPNSRDAPRAYVSLIRLYDSHHSTDSAMQLREEFSARYGRGGEWQKQLAGDSSLCKTIDSMAIANGLYVADASYRLADSTKNSVEYGHAARNYERLVESYPQDPHAAEALWNLAVILDTKQQDKVLAFARYTAYSKLPSVDSSRREQAALNAFAISQGLLGPDSLIKKGEIDSAAMRVVNAVQNYCTLFPHGKNWSKVMLGLGAVYFNRHELADAGKTYESIVLHGEEGADYFEALLFLGQCRFAEEKWTAASDAFEKVWKNTGDESLRSQAKKLLVQSDFLNAKRVADSGKAEQAAELYRLIDEKFPGSEYGDVVLFNAAEALEKIGKWDNACERYADLVKRYPQSKLAAGALFNAAGNYEKAQKFDLAAEAYEHIVVAYPSSDKAKDALFNVGFCYEKLGKPDKMAEANERYTEQYPGEKGAETMLLRSGAYYAKAGMADRAIEAYRNFIARYPRHPRVVEADFMLAKSYYDKGYGENALIGFAQTERQNADFAKAAVATDDFHAAEASYYAGLIKRDKFLALKFTGSGDDLSRILREKTGLLSEAEGSFRRVMEYRSTRIFEAANLIGRLYDDLADAWKDQERPALDHIKAAVREKDILTVSSELLQKSFIPYGKVASIAKAFDTISTEQRGWIAKSDSGLKKNMIEAGEWLLSAASVMQEAPVPAEIREKPVHFYQYQKRLLETVLPLKRRVRDYYAGALSLADSLGLSGKEIDSCRAMCACANYSLGNDYDRLTAEVVARAKDLGADLTKEEKEDMVFQLQDISYELQDKAIEYYEEGLSNVRKNNLESSSWSAKILESLARLNPTKYGRSLYRPFTLASDNGWIVRPDSAGGWNSGRPPLDGWSPAIAVSPCSEKPFSAAHAYFLGLAGSGGRSFFWKNLFLDGSPRSADVRIATQNPYRLYVNGMLMLSDTIGKAGMPSLPDSATGITSTLKGGDNWIAVEIRARDSSASGVAIVLDGMIDTAEHFTSSMTIPHVVSAPVPAPSPVSSGRDSSSSAAPQKTSFAADSLLPALSGRETLSAQNPKPSAQPEATVVPRTSAEVKQAIEQYKSRETQASQEIEKESREIEKLKADQARIDTELRQVKSQLDMMNGRSENR